MLFLTADSILADIFCPRLKFQLAVTYTDDGTGSRKSTP